MADFPAIPVYQQNLLRNGGMEIQQHPGPFTANGQYPLEGWIITLTGSSAITASQDSTHQDAGSKFCSSLVYTHNSESFLGQKLEDFSQLRGRTISLYARVRANAVNMCRLSIFDSVNGHRYSPFNVLTSGTAYETIKLTARIDSAATAVSVTAVLDATGTVYLDNFMLVIGPSAIPYDPLVPAEEWARCERYYQVIGAGGDGTLEVYNNNGVTAKFLSGTFEFGRKAVTPTVTLVGTWSVQNCNQPTISSVGLEALRIIAATTGDGEQFFLNNITGNQITVEANP